VLDIHLLNVPIARSNRIAGGVILGGLFYFLALVEAWCFLAFVDSGMAGSSRMEKRAQTGTSGTGDAIRWRR
jgi:hypothetical protein